MLVYIVLFILFFILYKKLNTNKITADKIISYKISLEERINMYHRNNPIDVKKHYYWCQNTKNIKLCCVLAVYARNDNYKNILEHIYKYCHQIILVYSENTNYPLDYLYLDSINNLMLIEVENKHFDTLKYYTGIKSCKNFDRVLLLNDSFTFSRDIKDVFHYLYNNHFCYNLMGMVNSYEYILHIQSYFFSFDRELAEEYCIYYEENSYKIDLENYEFEYYNFYNHIDTLKNEIHLKKIVDLFEIGFSQKILNEKKYNVDTYYYYMLPYNPTGINNDTLYLREVLSFPIKKTKI